MRKLRGEFEERANRLIFSSIFCFLMVLLAELGTALSHGDLGFSTLWPPCGLFFLSLTFAPTIRKDWLSLILAAAISNLISDWYIHGYALNVTLSFIAGNTLSAMSSACVARRLILGRGSTENLATMFALMFCGLLIHAPLVATFGLLFQDIFGNKPWTWLRWVAWWSSNAIGISCFGTISFFALNTLHQIISKQKRNVFPMLNNWNIVRGSTKELISIWSAFFAMNFLLLIEFIPPWGIFLINALLLVWTFRFGIIHSSIVLSVAAILRIYQTNSDWEYLRPFSGILFLAPPTETETLKAVTIVSVQMFIIERTFIANMASALFTDLHLKQDALVAAANSRERLMARMSHEIRTPLSGVLGLIEAWALQQKSKQRMHDLQLILNSATQLKRVIDDVLDFSKLSAGKMTTEAVRCNLREIFSEIISLHSSDAHKKGLSLELSINEHLPDEVEIDSLRLRQIVNNLVANAVKFTLKGFVRISVKSGLPHDVNQQILRITVEDSGIGISPSAMDKLFQPFEQLGSDTTRAYGGTGLGLAICRELTELLGGRIEAESKLGVGTSFLVHLPYTQVKEYESYKRENRVEKFETAMPSARKQKQILIVEDDPINQIVATRFIEAEGYKAKVVENGMRALEELEKHGDEFDLVFMDYFMPVMDGCEVTKRFRSQEQASKPSKHLPIIGLTASVLAVDHLRCRQAGMDDVLLKPIERNALREVISKHSAA
ncbi:MAG: hypothetical protein RI932_1034 [Pseudomonadota bacterium]